MNAGGGQDMRAGLQARRVDQRDEPGVRGECRVELWEGLGHVRPAEPVLPGAKHLLPVDEVDELADSARCEDPAVRLHALALVEAFFFRGRRQPAADVGWCAR